MSKTGNVFADALLKAGVQTEGNSFVEWVSREDIRFPFAVATNFNSFAFVQGALSLFNYMRRNTESIAKEWLKEADAVNTDMVLHTWIKGNTGMLRLVTEDMLHKFRIKANNERWSKEAESFSVLPTTINRNFSVFIDYEVMEGRFKLYVERRRVPNELKEIRSMQNDIDVLNYISEHRDLVEFIPIFVNEGYYVSHKEYRDKGVLIKEVRVSYFGDRIMKNTEVMSRLKEWFDEGNTINPKSKYFILANKQDKHKFYLRRDTEYVEPKPYKGNKPKAGE